MTEPQPLPQREPDSISEDDMPTVPIPARKVVTTFDAASKHERIEVKPPLTRLFRRTITRAFNKWVTFSTSMVLNLNWYPRVEPYVGYGTEHYSRLICRTVYGPFKRQAGRLTRGIRAMLTIPRRIRRCASPSTACPSKPCRWVRPKCTTKWTRSNVSSEFAASDSAGYLDLVAEHSLEPGVHDVSYKVRSRKPVTANLFTIPSGTKVGVISDVDDTIMVTQAPSLMKAAYNLLLLNPKKKMPVAGMNLLFNRIADMFPDAPFFYLSTSPWNVESSIRHFIANHGFPEGPLLLRDLDPRPKTFIPSGVQHKLEYAEQLMADFPDMKFILIGDDGQKDPTTYATIARRYLGRVLAIGIRQLSPREVAGNLGTVAGRAVTQPIPVTDVPVFTGTTGSNLMKTMLPFLKQQMGV